MGLITELIKCSLNNEKRKREMSDLNIIRTKPRKMLAYSPRGGSFKEECPLIT